MLQIEFMMVNNINPFSAGTDFRRPKVYPRTERVKY